MKKVFASFAIAGMLFTAACGNKAQESTEEVEVIIEETEEAIEEDFDAIEGEFEEGVEEVEEVVEG